MPPDYWCSVPVLDDFNWTLEQKRNLSSSDSKCTIFDRDYNFFSNMSYEEAVQTSEGMTRPKEIHCGAKYDSYFMYEQEPGVSIVSEWDLVCDKIVYRTNVQMALSVGKFMGSLMLGVIADKWGRKFAFNISASIYIIAGVLSFVTPWYWIFFFSRFLLGAAGSGVYNSAYTLRKAPEYFQFLIFFSNKFTRNQSQKQFLTSIDPGQVSYIPSHTHVALLYSHLWRILNETGVTYKCV